MSLFPLQSTLRDAVEIEGIGLHSGTTVRMTVRPAQANSGIRFRRVDMAGAPEIAAHISAVVRTSLATTLSAGEAHVATVEHVLSALAGIGLDNAVIEVDSFEVPIMDGSVRPLVEALLTVGLDPQDAPRRVYRVEKPIRVGSDDRWIRVEPAEAMLVDLTLDYAHSSIGRQQFLYRHATDHYVTQIAPARTFTTEQDLDAVRAAGFGLGGSLDNAIVATQDGVANPEGLRFADEFARHKVLDVVGDFALIGGPIVGKITAYRSGHETNCLAVQALLDQQAGQWQSLV